MTIQPNTKATILTDIMLAIFRVNGRLLEKGDQMVEPLNLTSARWQVLAATGGSGFALSKTRKGPLLDLKKRRMPDIAANGLLVMIPAAIFLNSKAIAGEFDAVFYSVQVVELIVGVVQLTLMSMNFRNGLRLAGKIKQK